MVSVVRDSADEEKTAVLSPEDEVELAKLRFGPFHGLVVDEFVNKNQGLVHCIARQYHHPKLTHYDFCQEGNFGLLTAIERWDATLGFRFATYASWWIRQGIRRAIENHSRTIRIPSGRHQRINQVHRLEGLGYSDEKICLRLDINQEELDFLRSQIDAVSLYTPIGEAHSIKPGSSLTDVVPHPSALRDMEQFLLQLDVLSMTELMRRVLNDREFYVMERRYLSGELMPYEDIADYLGLGVETVRKEQIQAIAKLQVALGITPPEPKKDLRKVQVKKSKKLFEWITETRDSMIEIIAESPTTNFKTLREAKSLTAFPPQLRRDLVKSAFERVLNGHADWAAPRSEIRVRAWVGAFCLLFPQLSEETVTRFFKRETARSKKRASPDSSSGWVTT